MRSTRSCRCISPRTWSRPCTWQPPAPSPTTRCCLRRLARASTSTTTTWRAATRSAMRWRRCSDDADRRSCHSRRGSRPNSRSIRFADDRAALLLGGFVILASASISISDNAAGNPFFYIQRQLLAAAIGAVAGAFCLFIPMQVWQNLGPLMLFAGLALLLSCSFPASATKLTAAPAGFASAS